MKQQTDNKHLDPEGRMLQLAARGHAKLYDPFGDAAKWLEAETRSSRRVEPSTNAFHRPRT